MKGILISQLQREQGTPNDLGILEGMLSVVQQMLGSRGRACSRLVGVSFFIKQKFSALG